MANKVLGFDHTNSTSPLITWLTTLWDGSANKDVELTDIRTLFKTYFDTLYYNHTVNSQFILTNFNPTTTSGFTRGTQIETTTNKVNIVNNSFPNGSQTYGFINFPLPSDYDGGTVTAVFHWTANSATANSVIWGLQAVAFADNGALDTAYGTAQEVTDANGSSAYTERASATSSAITIAGTPTAGKLVSWRVYRLGSGSDNLAVAASLISVVVNYTRA